MWLRMTKDDIRKEYNKQQHEFLQFDNENEAYSIKAVRYIKWLENKIIELNKQIIKEI